VEVIFYFMEDPVKKMFVAFLRLTLLTATTCGMALDTEPAQQPQTRVEVGVKKEVSKPSKETKSTKQKTAKHDKKSSKCQEKCVAYSAYRPVYQPTYYIKSIGADGGTVSMSDETVWAIADSSAYTASRWIENSPIIITPSKWYSKYDYYITNKLTNESVTAKLSQGPFVKYSIFIQQIDWCNGYVYLTNGTRWNATPDHNFQYWQVGQAILIGENNKWFDKDYILININENNYVSADILP
jgi:hypothetical protein